MSIPSDSNPDKVNDAGVHNREVLNSRRSDSFDHFDIDDELVAMLAEAETHVERLRIELARRRKRTVRRSEQAAQHEEADHLAEHLERAQVNWQQVREFFQSAISEYRAGQSWGEPLEDPTAGGSGSAEEAP